MIEIDIASLTVLICNCPPFSNYPLLKDISFNTKYLLVWCDWPVITYLYQATFGISHPRDFWKVWNCPRFTRAIPKFSKMHPGDLSQSALRNMWLLELIVWSRWSIYVETSYLVCTYRNWKLFQGQILSKDADTPPKISFFFRCYPPFFCYSNSITWFLHQQISKCGGFFNANIIFKCKLNINVGINHQ